MAIEQTTERSTSWTILPELSARMWNGRVIATVDDTAGVWRLECRSADVVKLCEWLARDLGYVFATLVIEETPGSAWLLTYVFYKDDGPPWVHVELRITSHDSPVPSISGIVHAADWHEREVEDLFGLIFEGHPRLGEFILHEDWPEGVNPMRPGFDARQRVEHRRRAARRRS